MEVINKNNNFKTFNDNNTKSKMSSNISLWYKMKNIIIKCPICSISTPLLSIEQFNDILILSYKCLNCHNEDTQQIDLFHYLSLQEDNHQCLNHPHNEMSFFYDSNTNNYKCIQCLLPKKKKRIKLNKYHVFPFIYQPKITFSHISTINKESICIRDVASISNNLVAYVIDRRVIIWNYITNKIEMSLPESNYISEIIAVNDKKLLIFGSTIRVWDLVNVNQSKSPTLFTDLYVIIQYAIAINDELIAFITEDGLFIWEYEIDDLNNVIPLSDLTAIFLFKLNSNIIVFGTAEYVCICDISNKEKVKKNKIYSEDNDDYIYGKDLSYLRILTISKSGILTINEINEALEYKCTMKIEIEIQNENWKYYISEFNDCYIILYANNKDVFILNPFNGKINLIYRGNEINKIKLLHNGYLGILERNEIFKLFDIDYSQSILCFENKTYGKISTFEEMDNGDIIICQVKQEFFYSILGLINTIKYK